MYYIKREERKNILEPVKQVGRSVCFVSIIDAINELQRLTNEIAIKYEDKPDYGGCDWQGDALGEYVYTPDKDIFLTIVYHDSDDKQDYEVPNIEDMIRDHIQTVKNNPTNIERKSLKMKEENTMTYYYEKIYPASATQAKQTIEHMSEEELVSDVLDRLENSLLDEQLVDGTWYTAEDLAQLRKDQAIISDPNLSFESKFSAIKDAYSWDDQLVIRVQDKKDLIPEKEVEFF